MRDIRVIDISNHLTITVYRFSLSMLDAFGQKVAIERRHSGNWIVAISCFTM